MGFSLSYVSTKKPTAVKAYTPGTYKSAYASQLQNGLNTLTNWKYDPLQDASYQALAKIYGARGNTAAKNTLADAAALNGGYQTSYAVSAAQQARNQYNQELAALVPDLEANAYNKAVTSYNAYKDADDTAYGRFRDTESDKRWQYEQNYAKYRDLMSDYQWGQNYNLDVYGLKKSNSGGGGGGRRSSGGGSSYGGSGGGITYPTKPDAKAFDPGTYVSEGVLSTLTGKKTTGGSGGSGGLISMNKKLNTKY